MAYTKSDIINYIGSKRINPNILHSMLESLEEPNSIDLSGITATSAKVLKGYKSVDKEGKEVVGTCGFNATIPSIPAKTSYVSASELPSGKSALVLVNGVWTLIVGK